MSKTGMPKRRSRASLVVAAGLCGALAFGGATAAYASDIQGHWNEAGMQEWIDYGILKGYDNGDYGPDNPTTRAELVAFLDRVMDYQKTADNSFSDLDKNWYTEVVLKGVAAGVIAGDDAGTMRPNDPVTREEAATIFARVLALDVDNAKPSKFSDASKVHSWAKGSVDAMVEAGYINGYPDGTFGPTQAITRAEVIGMLNNMFADLYQKSGTYSDGSDSSAVISAGDVVLKDEVVDGDLVIAEGVANGHVVLDGVTVKGKLIVRGGGANSVVIKGKSSINTVLVDRQDSRVRVAVEGAAKVGDVVVADDTASVKVEGEVGTVTVEASKAKVEVAASVEKIVVPADGAQLTLTSKADVKSIAVAGDDVVVEAEKGAAVEKVVISGADATISGSGDVEAVEVAKGASGATVETEGTKVENNGTGAVTIPGGTIAEGGSATTPETTTPGGGGGGGTVVPVYKKSELKTDIGEKAFVVGQQVEFTFSTVANDDKDIMVLGTSNFSDQDAIEKLEYYEVRDGKWYTLSGDFGPTEGFPMADATSKFRVTFKKAGNYSFKASMKRADNSEVLCSLDVNFSVAPAGKEVNNADEMIAALEDESVTEIKLAKDFECGVQLVADHRVAIHGQGHTITRYYSVGNEVGGILISSDDVAIDNLTVSGPNKTKDQWDNGQYGIKVYDAEGVTLENVTVKDANAGIQVNSSEVTMKGKIDVSGNEFGGIEVCKSANANLSKPSLNVTDATLVNTTENNGALPTIWIDEYGDGENKLGKTVVTGADSMHSFVPATKPKQLWFFVNNVTEEVTNADALKQKLADNAVSEIKLGADITVTDQVDVSRAVTIDGQGHTITSNNASDDETKAAGVLVTADGVTLKGLAVSGPNKTEAEGQATHWDEGQYGIKVYDAEGVTLENVTVKDANAGIQVNSSKVALKGKIDVSGNEFGGIEVCKGKGENLSAPSLDVTGATLANDSEDASSNPTVWIDGYGEGDGELSSGVVTGFSGVSVERADKNPDQLWFLIDAVAKDAEDLGVLLGSTVSEIKLGANITVTDQVDVSRAVTIDGQGHTITSNNASDDETKAAGVLVTADGVTLKGLAVSGPNANPSGWNEGQYGIKVYSAKNVILENVKVSEANAGIQVNSSKVTLKGTIDVSGNEFGGIEVCKGKGENLSAPSLDVTGATLANDSEDASSNPTVWIDGYGKGENKLGKTVVTGVDSMHSFTPEDHNGQLWFLLKAPSTADTSEGAQA